MEGLEGRSLLSTVSFAPQPQIVSEQAGAAVVALMRYAPFGSERVEVRTRDVTTMAGEDYLPVAETVTFRDGETLKFVVIPLVDDGVGEGEESLEVIIESGAADSVPLPYPGPLYGNQLILSIVERTDVIAPTVTGSKLLTRGRTATGIQLTFSEPMDPTTVQDVTNYSLTDFSPRPRPGRRFPGPVTGEIPLASATYDPATLTVTLTPARSLRLNGLYMVSNPITAAPSGPFGYIPPQITKITDAAGNRLGNATPGYDGLSSGFFNVPVSRRPNPMFGPFPLPAAY